MFKFIRSLFKSNESEWKVFTIRVKDEWLAKLVLTADKCNMAPHQLVDCAINFIFEAIENDYMLLGADPDFDSTLTELAEKLKKDKTDVIIDALNYYYENLVKDWESKNESQTLP